MLLQPTQLQISRYYSRLSLPDLNMEVANLVQKNLMSAKGMLMYPLVKTDLLIVTMNHNGLWKNNRKKGKKKDQR